MKTLYILAILLSAVFITTSVHANYVNDLILKMKPTAQKTLFAKLLNASGKSCSTVSKLKFIGIGYEGEAYWAVQCPTEAFAIQFPKDPSGDGRVTDCDIMKLVGVDCWQSL